MGNWVAVRHRAGSPDELIVLSNTVFQVQCRHCPAGYDLTRLECLQRA